VDRLHLQRYGDGTGFFGMLEAQDDPVVFRGLFEAARDWLRRQGMRRILGPFNLSINEECGLLVEGFDTPPVVMMGHALPYYSTRLEELGFTGAQDLLAYRIRSNFAPPPYLDTLIRRVAARVHLRPLHPGQFARDLAIIQTIFEDAWSSNWGFLPFTAEEFSEVGRNLKLLVPPEFVRIAEVDGEPAAMMLLFPNLNEAIRDLNGRLLPLGWLKLLWRLKVRGVKTARVPLMGVRRRFQGSRLGAALALMMITSLQKTARRHGIEDVEMSWILENNKGMCSIIESIGGEPYKRYRIYQKDLA
jgi:GNAT superfamily N-acetyltransferase